MSGDASTTPAPTALATAAPASATEGFKAITSQEELDRALGARLHQERSKFADYEDLKTKAGELDKLKEGQKSELQKEQDARAAAERDSEAAKLDLQEARLERAVITTAASKNIVDPEAAVRLLERSKITYDQDGRPNNVGALLDELVAAKPYLAGKNSGRGADLRQGARGSGTAELDPNDWMRRMTRR